MSEENQHIDPALLDDANPAGLDPNKAVNGGMNLKEKPKGIRKINKKGILVAGGIVGIAAIVATTTFNGTGSAVSGAAKDAIANQGKNRPTDLKRDALWYANVPDKLAAGEPTPAPAGTPGAAAAGTPGAGTDNGGLPGDQTVPDLTGKAVSPFQAATAGRTGAAAYRPGANGSGTSGGTGSAPSQADQLAQQQENQARQKRQQDLDSAMKAKLTAEGFTDKAGQQQAAAGAGMAGAAGNGSVMPASFQPPGQQQKEDDPNKQERKDAFLQAQRAGTDPDYSTSKKNAARSQYEVKAGSVIPAVMIGGINSDLPGEVIAQVRETVYDTKTGRYPLIPQGSRLVGLYDAHVAYGQKRILLAWNRIIYPDGSSFDLKGMPGADKGGYAGFFDEVDNHYLKIFGSAVAMSLISAGVQLSQPNNGSSGNNNNPSVSQTVGAALGQQIGQTAMTITQKNLNIQPTLEVRPGYQFNVMVTADMILSPLGQ